MVFTIAWSYAHLLGRWKREVPRGNATYASCIVGDCQSPSCVAEDDDVRQKIFTKTRPGT